MDALGHILIGEEDGNYACILQLALQQAGISNPVQLAPTPAQVISYLSGVGAFADRERYPLPAVIILGMRLPLLNGFDLLRWIRRRPSFRTIPIAVLSGSEFPGEAKVARELGADFYSVKPFRFEELVRTARWIRQEWLQPSESHQLAA